MLLFGVDGTVYAMSFGSGQGSRATALADPEWASKLADARLTEIRAYDKSASSVLY